MAASLRSAQTIAILADTPAGDPYVSAAEVRDFATDRLAGWRRLRIVAHPRQAELVMNVRYQKVLLGDFGEAPPRYRVVVEVEVVDGANPEAPPLWGSREERSPIAGAGAGGAHGNAWKRLLPILLKRFREAVEKAQPGP